MDVRCRGADALIRAWREGGIQEFFSPEILTSSARSGFTASIRSFRPPSVSDSKAMPGWEKTRSYASLAFGNEPVGALREAPVSPARAVHERPLQAYTSFASDRHSGACRNDGVMDGLNPCGRDCGWHRIYPLQNHRTSIDSWGLSAQQKNSRRQGHVFTVNLLGLRLRHRVSLGIVQGISLERAHEDLETIVNRHHRADLHDLGF